MVKNEYLFNISLLQITDVEIARVIRTRKVLTFFFSLVFTTFRFLRHSKYETKKRKNFSTEKNEKGKNKQPHPFENETSSSWAYPYKLFPRVTILPDSMNTQVMACSNEDIQKHVDIGLA